MCGFAVGLLCGFVWVGCLLVIVLGSVGVAWVLLTAGCRGFGKRVTCLLVAFWFARFWLRWFVLRIVCWCVLDLVVLVSVLLCF